MSKSFPRSEREEKEADEEVVGGGLEDKERGRGKPEETKKNKELRGRRAAE